MAKQKQKRDRVAKTRYSLGLLDVQCKVSDKPSGDYEMQRINVQYFYRLATILRPLNTVAAGAKVDEIYGILFAAENELRFFLWNTVMPPDTSYASGHELFETLTKLTGQIGNSKELDLMDVYNLTHGLEQFETVLAADYARRETFTVSKKGIYSSGDLVDRAETMFSPETQTRIPEAMKDIHESGRCVAFELPTAAGFHLFRGVEAVAKKYVTVVRDGIAPTEKEQNLGLGGYIKILQEHNADERVVNALDQLRRLHRNPTIHPEIILTNTEVVTTMGMAQSAIQAMVADMEKRAANPDPALVQVLPEPEKLIIKETEEETGAAAAATA